MALTGGRCIIRGRLSQPMNASEEVSSRPPVLGFSSFELHLRTGELRKAGHRLKLQPQPARVLVLLVTHAGEIVTREEIHREIWGGETFVDFEQGLNFCIKQIRAVLGDDAEAPRYIETLPRMGYRFIAPVRELAAAPVGAAPAAAHGQIAAQTPALASRRIGWITAAFVVLAFTVTLALWQPWRPRIAFQQRDWVLIARFENRTGEAIYDGPLEYALERELSNSQFANVVPRERIRDALALMKKPAETPVDAALGREVCLRDGGIAILLTGRIEKLDATYLLSTSVVDPQSGNLLASVSEEAANPHEVLAAVHRLSDRLRNTLGEKMASIQESNKKLEKVTTPSLRALQLYSEAKPLVEDNKFERAAAVLEQAVHEDARFASAHVLLALCYNHLGKFDEATRQDKRAFELVDETTDRERYFILASYDGGVLHDAKKAAEAYEVMLHLYPDDYVATSELANLYNHMGRLDEAGVLSLRAADMRPNNFDANFAAAGRFARRSNSNLLPAEIYLQRTEKIARENADGRAPYRLAAIQLLRAHRDWYQGDLKGAENEVEQFARTTNSISGAERDSLLHQLGYAYLLLGKLRAAEETFQTIRQDMRYESLVDLALIRGDEKTLRELLPAWVKATKGVNSAPQAMLLIQAGNLAEAPHWISIFREHRIPDAVINIVQGQLALARGDRKQAVSLLRENLEAVRNTAGRIYFLGTESLASTLQQQGDLPNALKLLDRAGELKGLAASFPPVGPMWLRVESRRAQLCRALGREQDARQIETELQHLLTYADPDHPIRLLLQHSQRRVSSSSPSPK